MTRTAPRPGARPDRDVATERIRGVWRETGRDRVSVDEPRCIARASRPTVFPPCPPSPSPALLAGDLAKVRLRRGFRPRPALSRSARRAIVLLFSRGRPIAPRGAREPHLPSPSLVSLDRRRPDPSPISLTSSPFLRSLRPRASPPAPRPVPPFPRDPPTRSRRDPFPRAAAAGGGGGDADSSAFSTGRRLPASRLLAESRRSAAFSSSSAAGAKQAAAAASSKPAKKSSWSKGLSQPLPARAPPRSLSPCR